MVYLFCCVGWDLVFICLFDVDVCGFDFSGWVVCWVVCLVVCYLTFFCFVCLMCC